ncbi:MAG: hypothetical protein ABF976_11855 [Acetobacter syzygii]|uniref:hypothetical protein n=1 Tax=Acetobacter syzygii TaxID=146476 RepID=UPI0039EB6857
MAALWKRLYSPSCIARFFGLKITTVAEAARRAGLPDRRGFPIASECPYKDPFEKPENPTLVGMMVEKFCRITQKLFFVRPKEKRTVHYSLQGLLTINKRQADVDNWEMSGTLNSSAVENSAFRFSYA